MDPEKTRGAPENGSEAREQESRDERWTTENERTLAEAYKIESTRIDKIIGDAGKQATSGIGIDPVTVAKDATLRQTKCVPYDGAGVSDTSNADNEARLSQIKNAADKKLEPNQTMQPADAESSINRFWKYAGYGATTASILANGPRGLKTIGKIVAAIKKAGKPKAFLVEAEDVVPMAESKDDVTDSDLDPNSPLYQSIALWWNNPKFWESFVTFTNIDQSTLGDELVYLQYLMYIDPSDSLLWDNTQDLLDKIDFLTSVYNKEASTLSDIYIEGAKLQYKGEPLPRMIIAYVCLLTLGNILDQGLKIKHAPSPASMSAVQDASHVYKRPPTPLSPLSKSISALHSVKPRRPSQEAVGIEASSIIPKLH